MSTLVLSFRAAIPALFALLACAACSSPAHPTIQAIIDDISPEQIRRTVDTLAAFGTRHTLSQTDGEFRGIGAARRWIKTRFDRISAESGGRLIVEEQSFIAPADGKRVFRDVEIVNLLATLPGDDPASKDRVYLVSGHYDSMCGDIMDAVSDAPGANDDASGVAAVLELARVMSKQRFEATIMFVAVAGEEQGLIGSRHMAKKMKDEGVNIAAMFTNDIIGNSTGQNGVFDDARVRVFSEGVPVVETSEQAKTRLATGNENDSASRQLARFIDECADRYLRGFDAMLIYRRDRFQRGGDHTAFSEQGYPAIRFTESNEDFRRQHQDIRMVNGVQHGDLPQFVDSEYVAQVARLNGAALAALAFAPAAPRNARILTVRLETTTTLRWDSNVEPDLAGYEIVWRETTAPQWQFSRPIGDTTEYTHELSKDNYIFGIRAVDVDGHRSVVSWPSPDSGPASQPTSNPVINRISTLFETPTRPQSPP